MGFPRVTTLRAQMSEGRSTSKSILLLTSLGANFECSVSASGRLRTKMRRFVGAAAHVPVALVNFGGLMTRLHDNRAPCSYHQLFRSLSVRTAIVSVVLGLLAFGAAAETCEIDADCTSGNVCQKDPRASPTRPGLCQHDPRVPRTLLVPPGVAVPRSDRDPSTRVPTTSRNPTGYAQCATDRNCPDGYTCTRRSSNENWYCRKR